MTGSIENIASHLKFLGYSTEKLKSENANEKDIWVGKHIQKNSVVFFELFPSFIMFRVNLTTERKFSPEMDAVMNRANKIFTIVKIYYEIENDKAVLRLEAIHTGRYTKESFGAFFDMFVADQNLIYKVDGFATAFLGTEEKE